MSTDPSRQLLAVERLARAKYEAALTVSPLDVGRVARAREAWVACVRRIGR